MIQERFYTEKEGRDPSIYLGIDGSRIPVDIFKGIFSIPNTIYTDAMYGIQFVVTEDGKSVVLATMNPDIYVTKEDIQSTDIWYKIGFDLSEYQEFTNFGSIQESIENSPWGILFKRYNSGETGLLEYEEKKYNDKGEYMRTHLSFDTRPHPEAKDIRDTLRRHINFVYTMDSTLPWHEREMVVKSNTNNLMQLMVLEVKPQLEVLTANGLLKVSQDQSDRIQYVMVPSMGKLQLEFDETIEDFFVSKIEK